MGTFKEFIVEDMRQTLNTKLRISPSEFAQQFFIANPPMKLIDDKGKIDVIQSPTRFKILEQGKHHIRIKNISFGNSPYEEVSPFAGKVYTIMGKNIDIFLKPPPGTGESMPMSSNFPTT